MASSAGFSLTCNVLDVSSGPEHQPLGAAQRCQHLERRPAEQKEALCGPLLSLLYTTELGNVTLQLINSDMSSVTGVC